MFFCRLSGDLLKLYTLGGAIKFYLIVHSRRIWVYSPSLIGSISVQSENNSWTFLAPQTIFFLSMTEQQALKFPISRKFDLTILLRKSEPCEQIIYRNHQSGAPPAGEFRTFSFFSCKKIWLNNKVTSRAHHPWWEVELFKYSLFIYKTGYKTSCPGDVTYRKTFWFKSCQLN